MQPPYMPQPQPPYMPQPRYAPPPQPPHAERVKSLGSTALVLACVQLVSAAGSISTAIGSRRWQKGMSEVFPAGKGTPAELEAFTKAAGEYWSQMVLGEGLRALPIALASGALIAIALRLRSGDASALGAARMWVPCAFVALGLSVTIQVLVTIPAIVAYVEHLASLFPSLPRARSGRAAPFDIAAFLRTLATTGVVAGAIFNAAILSIWPAVLWVWSGRLAREEQPLVAIA